MNIGYARVSTEEQELDLQIIALQNAGCGKIFTDKASGGNRERPGLNEALAYLREGDSLIIWKLDRLGRSVKNLVEISEELDRRKINLHSITEGIDTQNHVGRFYFHVIAAFAEMERELIRERTKAGIKVAREVGRIGGRRTVMTREKREAVEVLLRSCVPVSDIAKSIGVSVPTIYRHFPASGRVH